VRAPRPARPTPTSRPLASAAGFLLLLAALAPLTLWRIHLEASLWIDETYSLLLTTYPVHEILARMDLDANPPGYFLALKVWLKAARVLGFEPGVLWARLLNGLLWGGLAAAAWLGGRRLLGWRAGTLLAWVVAGGACSAWVARDLRGYGIATVSLFGAYLALVALAGLPAEDRRRRRLLWGLWSLYALCAAAALWTHLLSALALAALSVVWLALEAGRRRLGSATLAPAAAGHVLAALLFAPWLLRVGRQMTYMARSDPQWMTPPTLANLGRVFSFWYPFGRIGDPGWEANRALVPLGLAALLVPVLAAVALLAAAGRARGLGSGPGPGHPRAVAHGTEATALAGAVLGLGGSVLYVLAIWLVDRLDLAHTFHGPRYPVLAVHLWAAGLVCLATWAVLRGGGRLRWAALAFAPWLVASALGQVRLANEERRGDLSELREEAGASWPGAGEPLYLMPPELAPFYRRSLGALDVRRIERLPCEEGEGGSATVLDVNFWKQLDRPRDHLTRTLLEAGRLGAETRKVTHPARQPTLVLYRVQGLDGELLAELCRRGIRPPLRERMAGSMSEALPEAQLSPDHWSYLEVSAALETYRWSTVERTPVLFDLALAPGDYVLHVVGYRPAKPKPATLMGFALEDAGVAVEEVLPEGRFHVCLEVTWNRRAAAPVLTIDHPVWRTGAAEDGSRRSLSFLLYGAWLTPAAEEESAAEGCAEDLP
jgi:hypothetical protein